MVDLLQGNCEYEPAIKIVLLSKEGHGKARGPSIRRRNQVLVELDRRQAVARNKDAGRNRVQKVVGAEADKELLCSR